MSTTHFWPKWRLLASVAGVGMLGILPAIAPAAAMGVGHLPTAVFPDPKCGEPSGSTNCASLTITRLPGSLIPADPTGVNLGLTSDLAGDEFTVYKIDPKGGPELDLTTSAGWQKAQTATVQDALNAVFVPSQPNQWQKTGVGQVGSTGSNGAVTFSGLPFGLYLVDFTGAITAGTVPTQPFLVTLPMTDQVNLNAWIYDVYVYPKADSVSVSKSVDISKVHTLGDVAKYTIQAKIPRGNISAFRLDDLSYFSTAKITDVPRGQGTITVDPDSFEVTLSQGSDTLNRCKTPPTPGVGHAAPVAPVTPQKLTEWGYLPDVDNWNAATPANCDYYISNIFDEETWANSAAAVGTDGNYQRNETQSYYRIDFSPSGLTTLSRQAPGTSLEVNYLATVQTSDQPSLGGDADLFANSVFLAASKEELYEIDEANGNHFEQAHASATFVTGQYLILKTNTPKPGEETVLLDGAQFAIYAKPNGVACTDAIKDEANGPIEMQFTGSTGQPVPYGEVTQGPVDDDSLGSGLNGYGRGYTMTGELVYGEYCAVEVAAPEGYQLALEPFQFEASRTTSMGPWNEMCLGDNSSGYATETISGCKAAGGNEIANNELSKTDTAWPNGYYEVPAALEVNDIPVNAGFVLPLTGWNGVQTTIASFGIFFIVLAAGYALKQRRNA